MNLATARSYVTTRLGITAGENAVLEGLIDLQLDTEYQLLVVEHQLEVDVVSLFTNAANPVVDLPDDLAEILKINRGTTTLTPLTWDDFSNQVAAGAATSDGATAYVRSGANRIRVTPTPSEDGNDLTCWYARMADPWVDDLDVPTALPSAFHTLPCERAIAWLAAVDEALDLVALATARGDALEAKLRRHMGRRGGMGPSTIHIAGKS